MTKRPVDPYRAGPLVPAIIQPVATNAELDARLEAIQKRLLEEQAALPKPLTFMYHYVSIRLGIAIDEIEFARRVLSDPMRSTGGW